MWGVFAFLFGASVGSFLNVTIDRLPHGQSLVRPRSFCDACNRSLSSLDMVPVLSYLWLRGRCRYCSAKIPMRILFTEAVTGTLFTFLYFRYGFGIEFLVMVAVVSLMLVVAIIDLEHGLILNRIIYPAIIVLLILSPFWSELGLSRSFLGTPDLLASFLNSLVAGTGAFLVFLIITIIYPAGMGGGDVKLAGLIGLLVGFPGVLLALWMAVVAGGLMAITLLVLGKKGRKDSMPFGPFMAAGALVTFLSGAEIMGRYQEFAANLVGAWT
ncbi:MAG: prepilin peptidase [Chloroflexi bacterium]|nr:prepilin peptidase [Chloroflexota bacterium]MCH8349763.1 prepilin peptidase [Chloroflexota bacterium]MCI0780004.1 prepilin peptidase [Chloroflexota bacterium]MCI0785045.1 prepilin peptidase [Chloroflexota bacterium]MCI0792274.1 prepilin peptidase [Chloroflexota bacterium]